MNKLVPFADHTPPPTSPRARLLPLLYIFESLISTMIEGLKIGPLCPRPAPKALCAFRHLYYDFYKYG